MMYEEFEKEGVLYIREIYENGLITEYIKPSEAGTPKETAPTVPEEKVSLEERLKNLEQGQIATQEAIVTMYEDHIKRNLQIDETLATIYETLTDKGQENEKTK